MQLVNMNYDFEGFVMQVNEKKKTCIKALEF